MWFYNRSSQACERFTYGGCGGNANRFWSQHACNQVCTGEEALFLMKPQVLLLLWMLSDNLLEVYTLPEVYNTNIGF